MTTGNSQSGLSESALTTNAVTGTIIGPSVQSRSIHGGVHVHQAVTDAAPPVPRQLRPVPAHFTDREPALAALDQIAGIDLPRERPALSMICGPGGVGKSALALRWLHSNAERYPDGQLYVDLRSEAVDTHLPVSAVLGGFLRALGVTGDRIPIDAGEAGALFRSVTAGRRIAVLIDNASSAAQVRKLLPASPSSVVVVTSRWRLGGLVSDGAGLIVLTPLSTDAGTELLASTIGRDRVSQEPAVAARLVELCDGLPIALSIAGARLAMRPEWSLARMVRDLSNERRRLAALSTTEDVSVQEVFDLSYQDLQPGTARAYRLLSLHPGPDFTVDLAAAALVQPVDDTGPLLETLVDASLLYVDQDRFHFHDLNRLHAKHRAGAEDGASESRDVLSRVLEYYVSAAAAVYSVIMPKEWRIGPTYEQIAKEPPRYAGSAEALDDLEPELQNMMAVLRAGFDNALDELVWQLCEAMWPLFLYRKHFADWKLAYELGIIAAERCGNLVAKSRMHHHLGFYFKDVRECEQALEQGRLALADAQDAGHHRAESGALALIGMALRELGQLDEATAVLSEVVDLDHRAGRLRNEALNRRRLGQTMTAAGRYDDAVRELQQASALAAELADPPIEAMTTVWLAEAMSLAERGPEAITLLAGVWTTLEASGSPQYAASALMVWGESAERLGDLPAAREHLTRARDLFDQIGAPHVERVQRGLDRVAARLAGEAAGS